MTADVRAINTFTCYRRTSKIDKVKDYDTNV